MFSEQKLTDQALLGLMRDVSVTKIAIDAPFGWPTEFVRTVAAWHDDLAWPLAPDPGSAQDPLVLRATDRDVWHGAGSSEAGLSEDMTGWAGTGRRPLSVSTDRIAFAAMRCARLLQAIAAKDGVPVDRSGEGRVLEAYPEAALRQWKISSSTQATDPGGYKGSSAPAVKRRSSLVRRLRDQTAGVVDLEAVVRRCEESDDALDAVVCALVARAAEVGAVRGVGDRDLARREGWIRLPTPESLSRLSAEPRRALP